MKQQSLYWILIGIVLYWVVTSTASIDSFDNRTKQKCIVKTSDGYTVNVPEPWYMNTANPDQCFAPPQQKCCNQVVEGCMQNFANRTKSQMNDWFTSCA